MNYRRITAGVLALAMVSSITAAGQGRKKKKEKEEVTQTLPVLEDPPLAVIAEVERLVFLSAPLSSKGLLSQQVRDGLKALLRAARRATIVKVRAFVAGTGDMRRVQTIVSEMFTDKRQPIPALSTIQGGALPGVGVQVALEAIAVHRKPVNAHGLAFISGQAAPSVTQSVAQIQKALEAMKIRAASVRQVSCFLSSLEGYTSARQAVSAAFPAASANFVQMQRLPVRPPAECEAVAALEQAAAERIALVNPEGLQPSQNYAQVAVVGPGRLVISGTQLGFGSEPADIRLAFERLDKALEPSQVSLKDVVFSRIYPVSDSVAEKVRSIRFDFLDKSHPPASTFLPFEGLPSLDASFAIEVLAVPR
jgi:enamine deaminase RidA (YjgF/YER057c/UK114 family)